MALDKQILVMDDDEDVRFLMQLLLGKLGYHVEVAVDGAQAVAMYGAALQENRRFAAAILDLNIPGTIGGKEVATQLLALDQGARLFVTSGNELDPVMTGYQQYGFTGKLPKPFLYADAEALVKLIE